MKLPFTTQQFLDVFRNYNQNVFPAQLLLVAVAILIGYLTVRQAKKAGRVVSWGLAFLWAWMGIVYHFVFFSPINPAAYFFGALFVIQSILFVWGTSQVTYHLALKRNWLTVVMWTYAFVAYPIVGYLSGHAYPQAPTFGLPCPTTIFTFGVLLLSNGQLPWRVLIIPILWSLVGTSAFLQLGIMEDVGLPLSAAATLIAFARQKRQPNPSQQVA